MLDIKVCQTLFAARSTPGRTEMYGPKIGFLADFPVFEKVQAPPLYYPENWNENFMVETTRDPRRIPSTLVRYKSVEFRCVFFGHTEMYGREKGVPNGVSRIIHFCQKTGIDGGPLVFSLLTVLEVFGILRLKNRPKKKVP